MLEQNLIDSPVAKSFICPHCATRAQFNLIFPFLAGTNKIPNLPQARWEEDDGLYSYEYTIWMCQVCKKYVFRGYQFYKYGNDTKIIGQYPSGIRIYFEFSKSVPKEILQDFESAIKCYEFEEYRPCAAMSRRALQASLLEQGADPKKDLFDQIAELNKIKPDRFTNDIKDWAHNIRIFGNWGSHPDKDGLKDVNQETAKEVIEFLKSYFHYVYSMPQKVASARLKQEGPKKN